MTIDYQALRGAAQNAKDLGEIKNYKRGEQAVAEFESLITPHIVLALLDERERNQQYIKRRDQENEDIALTVGKLRVELEAEKSKLNEQREYYEGVISDGSKRIAELESDSQAQKLVEAIIVAIENEQERLFDEDYLMDSKECIDVIREEVKRWNACRAAMLHGAEPVSQTYKSQHTQFEQVADLYEMQFDDGRTCAFHTDAQKAAQWLQACDGNRVQEYVKLERLRNALSGNYPVTPDGWISCSERMPNEEDVLVYCSDTKEQMVGFHKGKGLFQFFYMNGVEGVCEPSHWMPLPEPPQEAK